jgi:hypothetical protein
VDTFVVRIWTSADPEEIPDGPALVGLVEHVRSGRSRRFHGAEELEAFLVEQRERPQPPS